MNIYRFLIYIVALGGLFAAPSFLAAQDSSDTSRELRILAGIFDTVLEESEDTPVNFPGRKAELLYLPGKGAVYTFNTGNVFTHMADFIPQAFPLSENIVMGMGMNIDVDMMEGEAIETVLADTPIMTTRRFMLNSPERRINIVRSGPADSEVDAAQQAVQSQQSEVLALNGSLTEAMANIDQADPQRLEQLQERLRDARGVLAEQHSRLRETISRRQQEVAAEQKAHAEAMAGALVMTLCDYGPTLRAMGNDEFVSLVLKNFDGESSRVLLFEARDVKNCRDADSLMGKASLYDM